ncbi:hypothetical protein LXL04_010385 [Taraxacum kok-saghyz]
MAREPGVLFWVLMVVGLLQFQIFVVIGEPKVPCLFVFGDSLVDNGNNNKLTTQAKANYKPYGVDFPGGPSGRFTNGRTIADMIGHVLGFEKFVPPHATATDEEIATGVNYASGCSGIRDETGMHLGARISLSKQIRNHKELIVRLSNLQKNKALTDQHLKRCIYISNIGSNDYINNFLIPERYPQTHKYSSDEYATILVRQYSQHLTALYNMGARKFAVFGLGQIGCALEVIKRFGTPGSACVDLINDSVNKFNGRLKPAIDKLNDDFPDSRFTFINVTSILAPQGGVQFPNIPCCKVREDGQCIPDTNPCPNRGLSVYYDGFHPTEVANTVLATRAYKALSSMDASPYDIDHLCQAFVPSSDLKGVLRPSLYLKAEGGGHSWGTKAAGVWRMELRGRQNPERTKEDEVVKVEREYGEPVVLTKKEYVLLHARTFLASSKPKPQVPCYFIFGDSLVDNGNNNKLKTKCKVNYPPYGIDFPEGGTGRFTNGRTSADIIGQLLGFEKYIPSYATATKKEISTGVNYASGGSGILRESGRHLGDRYSMYRQLRHHKSIVSRILHSKKDKKFLRKCIYVVNIGSNDYINNYYMPDLYNTSHIYTKRQFAKVLIKQYSQYLTTLYSLGGRKIAVFSLAPIGCSPFYINKFGTYGTPCVEKMNEAITLFNDGLKDLVDRLNDKKSDARFTFINLGSILSPLGDVPMPNSPCCQVREDGQCVRNSIPCPMRSVSIFFDGLHPTEVSNTIIATRSYAAVSQADASPYDISHLAQL